jgi:hypothetical protein
MSPVNPYFNHLSELTEQTLIEDLVIETIQHRGIDMVYVRRADTTSEMDPLFGEEFDVGRFNRAKSIEMYVSNPEGFEGEGDLITKFGLQINNSTTLVVSIKRFREELGMEFPREGDLIYIPFSNSLFEIRYVNPDNPFFQLGKLYTVDLTIESFQYSGEIFETGIPYLDSLTRDHGFVTTFDLVAGGSGVFTIGESISVGSNSAAVVKSFNVNALELEVTQFKGAIPTGGFIIGQASGASWGISSGSNLDMPNDAFGQNLDFQREGDTIVDWKANNPWGDI